MPCCRVEEHGIDRAPTLIVQLSATPFSDGSTSVSCRCLLAAADDRRIGIGDKNGSGGLDCFLMGITAAFFRHAHDPPYHCLFWCHDGAERDEGPSTDRLNWRQQSANQGFRGWDRLSPPSHARWR